MTHASDTEDSCHSGSLSARAYNDPSELTLVGLVALLVRRWRLMLITALAVVTAVVAFSLIPRPALVTTTTIYQVAERDAHTPLRPITDTQARIEQVYASLAGNALDTGLGVSTDHPDDTLQVILRTTAPAEATDLAAALHERVIALMEASDQERLERYQTSLHSLAAHTAIPAIEGSANSGTLIRQVSREEAGMGEVLMRAVKPQASVFDNTWLWLALGLVLGIIAAVVAACVTSFAASVSRFLRRSA